MLTWVFFGQDRWRAYTHDEDGANLPREYGPWNKFKILDPPQEASADLQAQGYWLFRGDDNA